MFSLPVFVGFIWIFFQVNTAIQVSINNQQHSRAQMLHLAFNSPIFPELKFRDDMISGMVATGTPDQFTAGTSDELVDASNSATVTPTIISFARDPSKVKGEVDQVLPAAGSERTNVRIRDTVTICTQQNPTSERPVQGKGYCR
ncbi:MAG: hypothetical protein KA715_04490 [Xanthomonadaceae bacterium]|nr:hypothetical protein [Xanthomonadaceae bacterium]